MEFNKQVSNPMLVGAIELMKADASPEHNKLFFEEFARAELMGLALVDQEPVEDETGKLVLKQGSRVNFPMLKSPDGRQFVAVFTDMMEVDKFKANQTSGNPQIFAVTLDDIAMMVLRPGPEGQPNPCTGVVVNPMGSNVIIPRESLATVHFNKLKAEGKLPPEAQLKIVPRNSGDPRENKPTV